MVGWMQHISHRNKGFTLLEILVVVIILGILAAVVVPQFVDQSDEVKQGAFIHSIKAITSSINTYYAANCGRYPEDVNPGIRPREMKSYFSDSTWTEPTPIGGQWDYEEGVFGLIAGVSVLSPDEDADFMRKIDAKIDDGNLGTGHFRATANNRYTYILAE